MPDPTTRRDALTRQLGVVSVTALVIGDRDAELDNMSVTGSSLAAALAIRHRPTPEAGRA